MEEKESSNPSEGTDLFPGTSGPKVWTVLLAQLGLFILCSGFGMVLYFMLCALFGWDATLQLHADSPAPERWQVRLQLGLGHFFGFIVSGGLTVWIFYRGLTQQHRSWQDYLLSRRRPAIGIASLGVLLMALSIPLVVYTLNINKDLPLPTLFKDAEAQATEALKGLLLMDTPLELLANLFLVALLPAVGEELVFRGVLQRQLMRYFARPLVSILVAAAVFSAIHFQFEGFLPRMLMGFLLGWLYWQTRNFWVPVLGHFFNNGIQVTGQYLYGRQLSTIDLEKDIQMPWQLAVLSVVAVWALMQLIRRQFSHQASLI